MRKTGQVVRTAGTRAGFARALTPAVRGAFLAALEDSCNVRRSAAGAGVCPQSLYRLRKRDAPFAAAWDEALRIGQARLREAADRARAAVPDPEWDGASPAPPGHTIRGAKARRVQLTQARAAQWTVEKEEAFLSYLAATCNVQASARAAGASANSAYQRRMTWPAFAAAWDRALDQGYARLEMRLVEVASNGVRAPEVHGGRPGPKQFDPDLALKVMRQHRATVKGGRGVGAGRRPPIEDVKDSILRKLDALRRGRAMAEIRSPAADTMDDRQG